MLNRSPQPQVDQVILSEVQNQDVLRWFKQAIAAGHALKQKSNLPQNIITNIMAKVMHS